jgi:hypothetical protein
MEGNANDSKGSSNGTSTDITYNTSNGKFNQGAGFNGTSSKITFADPSIGAAFTLMMWLKPAYDWTAGDDGIIDTYPLNLGSVAIRGNGDGKIRYSIGGVANATTTSIGNINGQYHHIAIVGSGSNTLKVIYDGVEIGSNTFGGNFTSTTLVLGNVNGADWFNGAMDEVAYFNTNLSAATILAYVNATSDTGFLQMF